MATAAAPHHHNMAPGAASHHHNMATAEASHPHNMAPAAAPHHHNMAPGAASHHHNMATAAASHPIIAGAAPHNIAPPRRGAPQSNESYLTAAKSSTTGKEAKKKP